MQELLGRVRTLETENRDLKLQLQTSCTQQQQTPVTSKQQQTAPISIVIPDDAGSQNEPVSVPTEPDEGGWITVVNKRNRIVKKMWQNEKILEKILVNPVGIKNKKNKTQRQTQRQTQPQRRSNNRRNYGQNDHGNRRFVDRSQVPQGHRPFNRPENQHPQQMNRILSDISNFLLSQTRQQMPIYQNRFF